MDNSHTCATKEMTRNIASNNAVGFYLLPSELIEDILLRLALPEIFRLKAVSKAITFSITGNEFRSEFNLRSSSDTWLFVYQKRSLRDSVLYGFTHRSNQWFKIPVAMFLFPIVPPGEDHYFLAASGGFFLFSSNNCRELIVVHLTSKTVRKIPPSPLGPRGTSSWRRSGLKLIAGPPGSNRFRFLFAEFHENRPVLFEYSSDSDTWRSLEAQEDGGGRHPEGAVFLSVVHRRSDSIVLAVDSNHDTPVILRPRFDAGAIEERSNGVSRLHVYGDSCMVIVRSEGIDQSQKTRRFTSVEVWGLNANERGWKFISKVTDCVLDKARKPYWAMMGCLEERDGIIRIVLVTNYEGVWDLMWICYDMGTKKWSWVPLPEFRIKGLNMAGHDRQAAVGPEEGEARVIQQGLEIARRLGVTHLVALTDSHNITSFLQIGEPCLSWRATIVAQDVNTISSSFSTCCFLNISRQFNLNSDILAKVGRLHPPTICTDAISLGPFVSYCQSHCQS